VTPKGQARDVLTQKTKETRDITLAPDWLKEN